jgi:D-xylose transport system substrate-binding protein
MQKAIKTLSFLILIIIVFSSCSSDHKKIKIGLMVPTYEIKRYIKDRDYLTAKATELGAEVIVANAENNEQLQIEQANKLIDQGADILIVIAVNQNTAAAIVRDAHNRNVKVIAYERLIQNADLDFFVAFDHYKVGEQMANYVYKLKPEGSYVMLGGDKTDKNAILIKKGWHNVLDNAINQKKIDLQYDIFIEDWSSENAEHEISRYIKLSGKVPDVILASNDGIAEGVSKVLARDNAENSIILTGLDAELAACKRIVKGKQTITVYKPLKKEAEIAAQLAVDFVTGKKYTGNIVSTNNGRIDVPSVLIDPVVVDASNLKQTVVADGFYSEQEIYGE